MNDKDGKERVSRVSSGFGTAFRATVSGRVAVSLLALMLLMAGCPMSHTGGPPGQHQLPEGVAKFASQEDFKAYLEKAPESSYYEQRGVTEPRREVQREESLQSQRMQTQKSEGGVSGAGEPSRVSPSRVSKTNVQVKGIDEPDIVKASDDDIFYSPPNTGGTQVIDAFPPEELRRLSGVDEGGKLLYHDGTLTVISGEGMHGYDVSDPATPQKVWGAEFNGSFVDARLYGGTLYVVVRERVEPADPCPGPVLNFEGGESAIVECKEIAHPVEPVSVDSTYNVVALDPDTGDVKDYASFVGTRRGSEVYMSRNAVYVTYTETGSKQEIQYDFIMKNRDMFPDRVASEIGKLEGMDLSLKAKLTEVENIVESYAKNMTESEQMRLENEFQNREDILKKMYRERLVRTGVVKIDAQDLQVTAKGEVPGKLLNQWSMDAYDGNFRMATTVGGWTGNTENDVYVLDGVDLDVTGKVTGMGKTERVYAVRFMGDEGYVVTFRRTDPLYVLDLSDPANPTMEGELEMRGYSSYLHPLGPDTLLGIGKQGGKVKLSLFDVSDPSAPKEMDRYMVNDRWSGIQNTHHAFLLDEEHGVFFLPGSKGGYVFSYGGDTLEMEKAVSTDQRARRAVYMDETLYVLSDTEVTVLSEKTWEKVNSLKVKATEPVRRKEDAGKNPPLLN